MGLSQIAKPHLQRSNCGKGGSFCSQHSWPQQDIRKSEARGHRNFISREATFWANQQTHLLSEEGRVLILLLARGCRFSFKLSSDSAHQSASCMASRISGIVLRPHCSQAAIAIFATVEFFRQTLAIKLNATTC